MSHRDQDTTPQSEPRIALSNEIELARNASIIASGMVPASGGRADQEMEDGREEQLCGVIARRAVFIAGQIQARVFKAVATHPLQGEIDDDASAALQREKIIDLLRRQIASHEELVVGLQSVQASGAGAV